MTEADAADLADLRVVADYQFGGGAGDALFPADADIELSRSRSGRPRQVYVEGDRVTSYGTDGRFTLGIAGGRRLRAELDDAYVVRVGDESIPFVRDGKNVFAKFVTDVDPGIRPSDEVCVVGPDGNLLGVGRAELSADAMLDFETGMAVRVREGAGSEE
ncbi:pseudouridine synthase [Haloferax mediterranei ATCC 33500]|uniref:Prefoldin alpha subunit n=1 Tax=Haloferax mediterranei (strain ATCC 33500 / DSM 1411 / JCM 8866 / NBRC 14739 / NCIMB 2177 / R-4) TaxID=523841 RepID=I3R3L9_HALMT|nr:PUA domain-containing protein [Haloferax mediterranei]AFK18829.1 prefoldin alpha subunit [Haloferax mediterranei ATCC 33500]AHZ21805.1 pseudouridine synthase [Haloferax mediterranei ATCC 33500]EMA03312.1 prefoldin subunit alpha [Haloferax mediterranei ATCC 33500]MDX5988923.1 PUA domain-containing protein [Haloferax mediterranei ATCC 33500]QCQ75319.1 pseudouridine synthase [Haloferax mediterranei ATCC 33500]